jgi:hypothetical protein
VACAASVAGGADAAPGPLVQTDKGCYLVGQRVHVTGSGFAASRTFVVSIDGVYFGSSLTDTSGSFSAGSLIPGGLLAGIAQAIDTLQASDGTERASTKFTLTRTAGARILATNGNPRTLRARFQIWGFALDGTPRAVYAHWLTPRGHVRRTAQLGTTGGQCGYLQTEKQRVFPFAPSKGTWTLQLDTRQQYARAPGGPVARIRVAIG